MGLGKAVRRSKGRSLPQCVSMHHTRAVSPDSGPRYRNRWITVLGSVPYTRLVAACSATFSIEGSQQLDVVVQRELIRDKLEGDYPLDVGSCRGREKGIY